MSKYVNDSMWKQEVGNYSLFHFLQKASARRCMCLHSFLNSCPEEKFPDGKEKVSIFCVKNIAGVSTAGELGLVDMGTRDLGLIINITSALKVIKTFVAESIASRIRLAIPKKCYQDPPMWEEWGGWRSKHILSRRYFWTAVSSFSKSNSLQASVKFVRVWTQNLGWATNREQPS